MFKRLLCTADRIPNSLKCSSYEQGGRQAREPEVLKAKGQQTKDLQGIRENRVKGT